MPDFNTQILQDLNFKGNKVAVYLDKLKNVSLRGRVSERNGKFRGSNEITNLESDKSKTPKTSLFVKV